MTQTCFSRDEAIQSQSTLVEAIKQTLRNINALGNAWLIDLEEHAKVIESNHFKKLLITQRSERPMRMVCYTSQSIT